MKILYLPSSKSQQRQLEKPNFTAYPILMAMECEKRRQEGHEVYWAKDNGNYNFVFDYGDHKVLPYDKVITEPEGLDFLTLPSPDRVFTRAMDKKYQSNGNFKYLPGTYIMSASGCWHGACSFCVEKDKPYLVRPVDSVIEEIKECKQMGFKSLFDDSSTFPENQWCYEFCKKVRNLNVNLGCNLRINSNTDFKLMANSGFEMVLIGVESANETTLQKINKGIKVADIIPVFQRASRAGLRPHASAIIGFPFESYEDTMKTINLIKHLLIKGYANTAQMSFYAPPKNQPQGNEEYRKYVTKFYEVGFNAEFWYNKIINIKSMADLHYLIRGIQKGFSALLQRRLT